MICKFFANNFNYFISKWHSTFKNRVNKLFCSIRLTECEVWLGVDMLEGAPTTITVGPTLSSLTAHSQIKKKIIYTINIGIYHILLVFKCIELYIYSWKYHLKVHHDERYFSCGIGPSLTQHLMLWLTIFNKRCNKLLKNLIEKDISSL